MANKKIAGITVEIGGDTTKLGKALSDVDKKSKNLKTELKEIDKALKFDPKNTELLAQKQQVLAEAIQNSKKKLETLTEAEKKIEQQFKNGEIDGGQYRAFKREIEATREELDYYEREASEAKTSTKKLGDELKSTSKDADSAKNSFEKAGNKVTAFGDGMTKAGEKASKASIVIAAAAAASYKAWEEADKGYDTIVKKTGATGEELESLKTVADNIFTTLPADMSKVGTAVGEVNTRFGVTGDRLEELSAAFIKYSEINDSDVNTSVDNVSAAMKAFGTDSSEAANVLDKLTSIGQRTGLSVSQLESTLASQSATFKEMGLSIGESAELLGQFEVNGVNTSTAITALKKAQQNATKSGKTLSAELRDNVAAIKNANSETEALQIATNLFGKSGAAAMSQAIRENRLELGNLDGSLNDTAGTVDKTFEATISAPEKMKVALNGVKLESSELAALAMDMLAPALKKLTSTIKTLTAKFNSLDESEKKTILKIAGIVAAIGPCLIAIGKLTSGVGGLISTVGKLWKLAAANPWVLAIGATVAALTVLYIKNEDFRNAVNETAKEFAELFKEIAAEMKQWYDENKPLVDNMIKVIQVLIEVLAQYLIKTIRDAMNAFKLAWTVISTEWNIATSYFKTIGENIKEIFKVVKAVLTGDFSGAWEGIKNIFSNTGEFFSGVWSGIKTVFGSTVSFFENKFGDAKKAIKNVFGSLGTFFGATKDEMIEAFEAIPEALAEIFRKALEKVKEIAGEIGDTVSSVADKIPGVNLVKSGASKLTGFFAGGGTLSKNGEAAIVGEAGPELLQLLNGRAVVTPLNDQTADVQATAQAAGRTTVHQTFIINVKEFSTPQDAQKTSEELARLEYQTTMGRGVATV